MSYLVSNSNPSLHIISAETLPAIVGNSGPKAIETFIEFFAVTIRNANTRLAYTAAVRAFLVWLQPYGPTRLADIRPLHVAGYIEDLCADRAAPTAKQHLAAIRRLFDWLVARHVLADNPATSVRGPSHSQATGRTPHLLPDQMRALFESIGEDKITDLRDKALIGVMAYTFARVSAAVGLDTDDVITRGRTLWIRLSEKGGKQHEMPCHHELAVFLDAYMAAAGLTDQPKTPLFRSATRQRTPMLTDQRILRHNAWAMVKRRVKAAGLDHNLTNHSFRATGITTFLANDGDIMRAKAMAAHSSIRTTQVYDRRDHSATVNEVERVRY